MDPKTVAESQKDYYATKVVQPTLHQLFPGFYLKEVETQQRGLLVKHTKGSGKSYTALHFFRLFSDKIGILCCLPTMVDEWKDKIEQMGLTHQAITIITLDEFIKNIDTLSDTFHQMVAVFDDSHLLIDRLQYRENNTIRKQVVRAISQFHKFLFLTNTLLYRNVYDVVAVCNLVSGQTLLPIEHKQFDTTYFVHNPRTRFVVNWLFPAVKLLPRLALMTIGFYGFAIGLDIVFHLIGMSTNLSSIPAISAITPVEDFLKSFTNAPQITKLYDSLNLKVGSRDLNTPNMAYTFLYSVVIINVVRMIERLYNPKKDHLDKRTLGRVIQRYVSYYNAPEETQRSTRWIGYKYKTCHQEAHHLNVLERWMCESYLSELDKSDYPYYETHIQSVEYTTDQQQVYLRMTHQALSDDEKRQFGIVHVDPLLFSNFTKDDYLQYGRLIGNLSTNTPPPKFIEVYKISKQCPSVVIYSNFYENGIVLFSRFLEEHEERPSYRILEPTDSIRQRNNILRDFKNKEFQYLLLHPVFREGINIEGTQQLHLLEPMETFGGFEQVVSRVIRYHSHHHLPLHLRKVKVFQWKATTMSFGTLLRKRLKKDPMFSVEFERWERIRELETECSADSILLAEAEILHKHSVRMDEILQEYSIEACHKSNKEFYCLMDTPIRR